MVLTAAIAHWLDAQGHGVYGRAGTNLFLEELPSSPVDAVSVGVKAAPGPDLSGYDRQGIQVVVRHKTGNGRARPGYERAQQLRDALHGLRHTTLAEGTPDEVRVVWCLADDGGPTNLGDDGTGVPRWSLRFIVLTPSTLQLGA